MSSEKIGNKRLLSIIFKQRYLIVMSFPFLIWIFIFSFGPMYGWLMAFQDFDPNRGVFGSEWVGLAQFISFFENVEALRAVRNTVAISTLNIIAMNIAPLLLALLINEVYRQRIKRIVQTISYLPYFVSFVVVANLFLVLLGREGPINDLMMMLGLVEEPFKFWTDQDIFWYMVVFVNTWKNVGFGAIIYLAAIASVNPELYEAATVDGCGRFKRVWYVTIPSVIPTITVLWILSLGDILSASFEPSFLLANAATREAADVIATLVFRLGISMGLFSFSTAVTLMQILIGFILIYFTNRLAKKYTEYSLW